MEVLNSVVDYRYIVVLAILAGISGIIVLWQLIRAGYVEEVKAVLLYFVTKAEQMFGGKTGKLKRAAVLAWIYEKMPAIVRFFITSEAFGTMIDEAVEEMKRYLQSNANAAAIVSGEAADDE